MFLFLTRIITVMLLITIFTMVDQALALLLSTLTLIFVALTERDDPTGDQN